MLSHELIAGDNPSWRTTCAQSLLFVRDYSQRASQYSSPTAGKYRSFMIILQLFSEVMEFRSTSHGRPDDPEVLLRFPRQGPRSRHLYVVFLDTYSD